MLPEPQASFSITPITQKIYILLQIIIPYKILWGVYMRISIIITMLVIGLFLAGCATKEITTPSQQTVQKVQPTVQKTTTYQPATPTASEPASEAAQPSNEVTVKNTGSVGGDSVTLKKLGKTGRTYGASEKCDIAFPLECPKYYAKDGIVYVTIKNAGYVSKIDKVVFSLKGENCDPVSSYIEPGQIKEFTCYVDTVAGDYVSGNIALNFYSVTEQKDVVKTGTFNVMME